MRIPTDKTATRSVRPVDGGPARPDLPGEGQQSPVEAIADATLEVGGREEGSAEDRAKAGWFKRLPDESPAECDARWRAEGVSAHRKQHPHRRQGRVERVRHDRG